MKTLRIMCIYCRFVKWDCFTALSSLRMSGYNHYSLVNHLQLSCRHEVPAHSPTEFRTSFREQGPFWVPPQDHDRSCRAMRGWLLRRGAGAFWKPLEGLRRDQGEALLGLLRPLTLVSDKSKWWFFLLIRTIAVFSVVKGQRRRETEMCRGGESWGQSREAEWTKKPRGKQWGGLGLEASGAQSRKSSGLWPRCSQGALTLTRSYAERLQ